MQSFHQRQPLPSMLSCGCYHEKQETIRSGRLTDLSEVDL